MKMIVIYDRPSDYPDGFCVRAWNAVAGVVQPGELLGSSLVTLEDARAMVPVGMVNLGRSAHDDPGIVEVWA